MSAPDFHKGITMSELDENMISLAPNGSITLPELILFKLGWHEGTRLVLEIEGNTLNIRHTPLFKPTTIEETFGCLKSTVGPVSLEAMDEAVMREAKNRMRNLD